MDDVTRLRAERDHLLSALQMLHSTAARPGTEAADCAADIEGMLREFQQQKARMHELQRAAREREFRQAWARMEAAGYRYGDDALEQVRMGWRLARGEL